MGEEREESGKISRRKFLKSAGLVVGGTTIGSAVLLNSCSGGTTTETVTKTVTNTATSGTTVTVTSPPVTKTVEVSATNTIKLTVNGNAYELIVKSTDTLRDTLHEQLGICSPKDMCNGYGACGSCSVIMNGCPILACMVVSCECSNAVIETAEGIAQNNHPIVEAYIMNNCAQCGYCTPGFLVTSKNLLDHNNNPTVDDIKLAISGNICRCGPYPTHIAAVQEAAKVLRGGK